MSTAAKPILFDDFVPGAQQLDARVRANVTGATGDQDPHCFIVQSWAGGGEVCPAPGRG